MESSEVCELVKKVLIDVLPVSESDVTLEASIVSDLGAESIDFLGIVFMLEKAADIEILRADLMPEDILASPECCMGSNDIAGSGFLNDAGVAELRKRMPFADLSALESGFAVSSFGDLLTIGDLCRYVELRLSKI